MPEAVNHPSHYNAGKIEVIDAIEDWQLGFHEGNVVKYVARAKHKKNELEDLKKSIVVSHTENRTTRKGFASKCSN